MGPRRHGRADGARRGTFSLYHYSPHSISGHAITPIEVSVRYPSPSLSPILLAGGTAICQEPNGTISPVVLPTHEAIALVDRKGGASPEKIRVCFQQTLRIGRLGRAWDLASLLKDVELFRQLGEAAMSALDIPMATRCYRELGDAGMVLSLQKLEGLEDAHVLSGHLALVFDDHAAAQDHFLQSTRPLAALEMRRDLLHWEQALKLAKTLAVEQVPTISREFAKQLEFRGARAGAADVRWAFGTGRRPAWDGHGEGRLDARADVPHRHGQDDASAGRRQPRRAAGARGAGPRLLPRVRVHPRGAEELRRGGEAVRDGRDAGEGGGDLHQDQELGGAPAAHGQDLVAQAALGVCQGQGGGGSRTRRPRRRTSGPTTWTRW